MARRSARLQKRSATPEQIGSGSETTEAHTASHNGKLPSVVEERATAREIAVTTKTPTQSEIVPSMKSVANSQIPLPTVSTPTRTPSRRPLRPTGEEMHPAHHHASTAKVLDEARWLGFQSLGAYTAPGRTANSGAVSGTPTRTPATTKITTPKDRLNSPTFQFRFNLKSPFSGPGPNAKAVVCKREGQGESAVRTALFQADEFTAPADISTDRKTAVPKGKMSRYSAAHMSEFKKMDSIANHPSAFRAAPNKVKVGTPVQSSSKKVEPAKEMTSVKTLNTLKRKQSKLELEETSNIPSTPLKRAETTETSLSNIPRSQPTVQLLPPPRDGLLPDISPVAKRVKRNKDDDTASTRPPLLEIETDIKAKAHSAKPVRKITSQTAFSRLTSRLMTPTRSSVSRSQSAKAAKSQYMIPTPTKLPSKDVFSPPTPLVNKVQESVKDGLRKTSDSLQQKVRSILRTPNHKFSEDVKKIAQGTHLSPPPGLDMQNTPVMPTAVSVKKQVNFSNSTLYRAAEAEAAKSPSPMKFRAGSEVPAGTVLYPILGSVSNVEYPRIGGVVSGYGDDNTVSPSRRLTFGGKSEPPSTGFSFTSGKPMTFGSASSGTIRVVGQSNVSTESKKRKLDAVEELSSDKENSKPASPLDGHRSAKKIKHTPTTPSATVKMQKTPSRLPQRTPLRGGSSISKSRLAFLATPKKNKV